MGPIEGHVPGQLCSSCPFHSLASGPVLTSHLDHVLKYFLMNRQSIGDWTRAMQVLTPDQARGLRELAFPNTGLEAAKVPPGILKYLGPYCSQNRSGSLYLRAARLRYGLMVRTPMLPTAAAELLHTIQYLSLSGEHSSPWAGSSLSLLAIIWSTRSCSRVLATSATPCLRPAMEPMLVDTLLAASALKGGRRMMSR